MIFNEGYGSESLDNVKPSPYELGLEGALMHVYENECNYNAIIKSVGLAEMKYYAETGRDLFLNEAGAISGFFQKVKAFFKKVIEKIKAIFKKFVMVINQYAMSDKQFANKYEKDVVRASLKDFEFKGYKFGDLSKFSAVSQYKSMMTELENTVVALSSNDSNIDKAFNLSFVQNTVGKEMSTLTSDDIQDIADSARCKLVGKIGGFDETEFRNELKDILYGNDGEKEILEEKDINVRQIISQLKDNKKDIRDADRERKDIEKEINDFIKGLERAEKDFVKTYDDDKEKYSQQGPGGMELETTETKGDLRSKALKTLQNAIKVAQNLSNSITIGYGMLVQAFKDRARQNKAICVKLVGRKVKDESYSYGYGSYDTDGIFSDVVIR